MVRRTARRWERMSYRNVRVTRFRAETSCECVFEGELERYSVGVCWIGLSLFDDCENAWIGGLEMLGSLIEGRSCWGDESLDTRSGRTSWCCSDADGYRSFRNISRGGNKSGIEKWRDSASSGRNIFQQLAQSWLWSFSAQWNLNQLFLQMDAISRSLYLAEDMDQQFPVSGELNQHYYLLSSLAYWSFSAVDILF